MTGTKVVLSVHYGDPVRWDHARLQQVQAALGRECDAFDGLSAYFDFDTREQALEALLIVRKMGVRAETCGIGEGPSASAAAEAHAVARDLYRRRFGDGS